jgi:hypothetical protein
MGRKVFFILAIIFVFQFSGLDLCYSYPATNDNPAFQQWAVQENGTAADLFNALLTAKADKIQRLITIVKWVTAYITITIAVLTVYFNSLYKRRNEDEDWPEFKLSKVDDIQQRSRL